MLFRQYIYTTKELLLPHVYFFRCLVILSIFFALTAQANDEPFEPTNQPITIAINKTTYPYMYLDDDGKADGLMPDLWRLWAERQGIEIEFKTSDWLSTLSLVESGEQQSARLTGCVVCFMAGHYWPKTQG